MKKMKIDDQQPIRAAKSIFFNTICIEITLRWPPAKENNLREYFVKYGENHLLREK